MPLTYTYDPDNWLVSLQRTIKEFLQDALDENLWQIVMDFPESDDLPHLLGEDKILVHLAVDDIENHKLGYGDDVISIVENPPEGPPPAPAGTVDESEGHMHIVNFDVGIWAYDKSGGVTLRLETYQMLTSLLHGARAYQTFKDETEGVEILRFNGGRWVTDRVGGTRVFRTVDSELVVRVYSRKLTVDAASLIDEIVQEPGLTIDGNPIT